MIKRVIITLNIPFVGFEGSLGENFSKKYMTSIKDIFIDIEKKLKVHFPKTTLRIEGVDEFGQKSIEG